MTTSATNPPPYIRRPRAQVTGYSADQVAKAYNAPVGQFTGKGVTIGVIELGGAYNPDDLRAMGLPTDGITVVPVGGAQPVSDPNGADGEVMLDVEIIAQVAPGAAQRVYFAENTNEGFLQAVTQAANETDIVSISWGAPEDKYPKDIVDKFAAVFASARAKGVPVFAAAGDSGSKDGETYTIVDYPSSDPSVLGCGGTTLTLGPDGKRLSETAWNDDPNRAATGGGVSAVFPGRQVPDVAGNADADTGYAITVNGQKQVAGGTSAVSPLYAATTALLKEAYGSPWDYLNTVMTNPTICFDVTVGDNGDYRAGPGRDQVSGFGVVDVGALLAVLQSGRQIPAPAGRV